MRTMPYYFLCLTDAVMNEKCQVIVFASSQHEANTIAKMTIQNHFKANSRNTKELIVNN